MKTRYNPRKNERFNKQFGDEETLFSDEDDSEPKEDFSAFENKNEKENDDV